MATFPKPDPIRFLVYEKFGGDISSQLFARIDKDAPHIDDVADLPTAIAPAAAYMNELAEMPTDVLERQVQEILEANKEAARLKMVKKETAYLFGGFEAFLNREEYLFYVRADYWTRLEANCLLLDRRPLASMDEEVDRADPDIEFRKNYVELKNLLGRAFEVGALPTKPIPQEVIEWAREKKLNVPEYLDQAFQHIVDRDLHGIPDNTPLIDPERLSSQQTRLQNNLYRLIIGMAVRGYRYDPDASQNDAIADIAADMQALGIKVGIASIRKYLKTAKEFLPGAGIDEQ